LQWRRSLARNTLINIVGFALPISAALVAVPRILEGLGSDRFGVLVLAWAVVGYMGVLDLGLGQSLTRNLAAAFANGDEHNAKTLIGSALLLLSALACLSGLAAFTVVPWIVVHLVELPVELVPEAHRALSLLALVVPAVVASAGLSGALEAKHRFDLSNAVSMPLGVASFLGPLVALQFTSSLIAVVAVLAACRFVALGTLAILVDHYVISLRRVSPRVSELKALARFGGWVTVSRIIVPLMGNFDRFAIATLVSLKALAIYAPPVDIAVRLLVLPGALSRALLPTIALNGEGRIEAVARLLLQSAKFCLLTMCPCALIVILYAPEALRVWLGPEHAVAGAEVLKWMMLAVALNGFGYPAATLLLGLGRPHVTAQIQLATVPVYFVAIWIGLPVFGIAGAAAIWAARVAVDTAAHWWFAIRAVGFNEASARLLAVSAAMFALLLATILVAEDRTVLLVAGSIGIATAGWFLVLDGRDRTQVRCLVSSIGRRRVRRT
jgi:O-antigen/teichoic acid export membrane protein